MQFLILTRRLSERFPEAAFAARIDEEVAQARVLYAEGFFRHLWHRRDVAGACLLIEADSEDHVRERLDTLPLFRAGMLDVSIIPLKPYAGFGPPAPKPGADKAAR
jgi:muconolactone delta-isomerase